MQSKVKIHNKANLISDEVGQGRRPALEHFFPGGMSKSLCAGVQRGQNRYCQQIPIIHNNIQINHNNFMNLINTNQMN